MNHSMKTGAEGVLAALENTQGGVLSRPAAPRSSDAPTLIANFDGFEIVTESFNGEKRVRLYNRRTGTWFAVPIGSIGPMVDALNRAAVAGRGERP